MRVIPTVYDDGTRADVPEGAWIQPVRRGYTMTCCDCGLRHRFGFRVRDGRAQFRAWRLRRRAVKGRSGYEPDR